MRSWAGSGDVRYRGKHLRVAGREETRPNLGVGDLFGDDGTGEKLSVHGRFLRDRLSVTEDMILPSGTLEGENVQRKLESRMPHRIRSRVKRVAHGVAHLDPRRSGLLLVAFIWALVAASRIDTAAGQVIDSAWHLQIPPYWQTAIWLSASLTALAAAVENGHTYPNRDTVALMWASAPPVMWLSSHFWSWVMSIVPGPPPGSESGWVSAGFYAAMVGLVWLVAAIPDPRLPPSTGDVETSGGA